MRVLSISSVSEIGFCPCLLQFLKLGSVLFERKSGSVHLFSFWNVFRPIYIIQTPSSTIAPSIQFDRCEVIEMLDILS